MSSPQLDRSAVPTIRGYCYQFDKTILELLDSSNDGDTVLVEHVEDIGLESPTERTATQCKYLPSKQFSLPVIRDAVVWMLKGFEASTASITDLRYSLYIHNADGGNVPTSLTLAELEKTLTYRSKKKLIELHVEHGWSDTVLTDFLARFTISHGPAYEDQQAAVIKRLRQQFTCSELEADSLYYNNALRVIVDLATNTNPTARQITRGEFLSRIDIRVPLFSSWYLALRGQKAYQRLVRERIKTISAWAPHKPTVVLLSQSIIANCGSGRVAQFVDDLARSRFQYGKSLHDTHPLTFVIDGAPNDAHAVKSELIGRQVRFNDGHEHIRFSPEDFNRPPFVYRKRYRDRMTDQIADASYTLRVVSSDTFRRHASTIFAPDSALILGETEVTGCFPHDATIVLSICATTLEDAAEITKH